MWCRPIIPGSTDLLAFVRGHMEQAFTVLATAPIAGRLSDFSIGAMRRPGAARGGRSW